MGAGVRPQVRTPSVKRSSWTNPFDDGGDVTDCEIMVTYAAMGARTRMQVNGETTIDDVVKRSRFALGLAQDFLKDSDFKVYKKDDESKPLSGKFGELGLIRRWAADGTELHVYYEG